MNLGFGFCTFVGILALAGAPASALPVKYTFDGTATGTVTSETTGMLLDPVDQLPFTFVISGDTEDLIDVPPFLSVPGAAKLSVGGTDFVGEGQAFLLVDPTTGRVGQTDGDEFFISAIGLDEFVGYDLKTSIGPIAGFVSSPFVSTEILNPFFGEPVRFEGTVDYSFEAHVVPLPAALPMLAAGLGVLSGLRYLRKR